MAVLGSIELRKSFNRLGGIKTGSEKSQKIYLISMDPRTAMIKVSSFKSIFCSDGPP